MGGFAGGLIVGFLLGGAVVFTVLEKPWQSDEPDAAEVADAGPPEDSNDRKKNRRRRRSRRQADGESGIVELSAADKRLVWRGPKPEIDERDMDFGAGGGGRALNRAEIDAGIASVADGIIDCIKETRGNAELKAKITLEARVEPDGRVGPARVRAPAYLHENGLLPCMKIRMMQEEQVHTVDQVGVFTPKPTRVESLTPGSVVTVPFDLY